MTNMEPRGTVLPVYFVADESGSMTPNISELNDGLTSLQDALQKESFAASKIRFSVIGFSDSAFTHLELADLRTLEVMPTLQAAGMTSYAAAFDQLTYRLSIDVPTLKGDGFMVNRPAVFFLTDGQPNAGEDWRASRSNLLAQSFRPNILAFGIGDADAATIKELATKDEFAMVAARGHDTGAAIATFMASLTHSMVNSGQALASAQSELVIERPEGFSLAVDIL